MKKLLLALFIGGCSTALSAQAAGKADQVSLDQSSLGDDVISVYGAACEKVKPNEPKSSLRVKVTDKASYIAVSTLSDLVNVKKDMNEHDYNVMIYNLVDDCLEDMAIRTTKQTEEELCVEVTGYLTEKNVFGAIENTLNQIAQPAIEEEVSEPAQDDDEDISETAEQPEQTETPEPQTEFTPAEDTSLEMQAVPTAAEIPAQVPAPAPVPSAVPQPETETPHSDTAYVRAKEAQKGLIYIAPTEFYNNTSSRKQAEVLKNLFNGNDFFYLTDKPELADYIIRSKVLRAKVDPINSNTNRMQMVVSVERERRDDHEKATEHQNRFMLFTSEENEQAVASKLLKQLLEKAGEKIMRDIEKQERKKISDNPLPSVITPSAGGAKADVR